MAFQLAELDKWVVVNGVQNQVFRVENGQYVTLQARAEPAVSEYSEPRLAQLPAALWVSFAEPLDPEGEEEEPDYGEIFFIGQVGTYDEFQFWAPSGYFKLWAFNLFQYSGDPGAVQPLWVYTGQGDNWSMEPIESESFARVMDRAPRNEEFDNMMQKLLHNSQRMMQLQADERERAIERRIAGIYAEHKADLEALRAERESPADGGEGGGEPPAAGGASDESAPAVKGGKGKSNDVA